MERGTHQDPRTTSGETRDRLLFEHLERLATHLRADELLTPDQLEEQVLRLLTGGLILLKQHKTNKRGQCRYCGWTWWTWQLWLLLTCGVGLADVSLREPFGPWVVGRAADWISGLSQESMRCQRGAWLASRYPLRREVTEPHGT